ncbi:MAG TPA: glycosyltransferase family 39 protein [Vicinamibacterales bacterium]|nr:glycosyltransferase family 39 protein [Vicinamibacterales bacterium]
MRFWISVLLVAYLPGALVFRLPLAERRRRAALSAEERLFWHVILSVAWSLAIVLALAAFGEYRFDRLLIGNALLCGVLLAAANVKLRYRAEAIRPTATTLLPMLLVALAVWRFFPSSEYVIGGKDPGTYMNEGIQIAQRGSLVTTDPVVAAVPEWARELFYLPQPHLGNEGLRFMGFFLLDARQGHVVGQFPHVLPASIAVGYGLFGLSGARMTVGIWAALGVLAVYFAGARLVGRAAAFGAAVLLSLHVLQVWFSRYPNAEVAIQTLLFASLLAFARAHQDDDRFFAPVAGALIGLMLFLRIDTLLAIVAILAAAVLAWLVDRKPIRFAFLLPLSAAAVLAWFYFTGPMRGTFWLPRTYLSNLPLPGVIGGLAAAIGAFALLLWSRSRFADRARRVVPTALAVATVLLAAYAYLLRAPGGKLADYDAYALRTFTDFFLLWPALVAALLGFVLVVRRDFWRDPAFVLVFTAFSIFLFYKVKVAPNHFWMDRRFLSVILPAALVFVGAAALGSLSSWPKGRQWLRVAVGVMFLGLLGQRYAGAASPLLPHIEYEGVIPSIERLASKLTDRDLVLIESRNAGSDTHVLGLPLAYIYARKVLVLESAKPDKAQLFAFLEDARQKYDRVLFVGGGGTDLLSGRISATPIGDGRVQIKEYEASPWNVYPQSVRRKDFDYTVYQLSTAAKAGRGFVVDVGYQDDLYVVRFHAKEQTEGRMVRWTQKQSFVAVSGLTGAERTVVFEMHDGGRPKSAPPARVQVFFGNAQIGTIDVQPGFRSYTLALPAAAVEAAARLDDPTQLRLLSTVWNPRQILGLPDDRDLGVMIDRIEVR